MFARRILWARDYLGRDPSSYYYRTRGTHRSCLLIDLDKRRPSLVLKAAHRDAVRVLWPKHLYRHFISSDDNLYHWQSRTYIYLQRPHALT